MNTKLLWLTPEYNTENVELHRYPFIFLWVVSFLFAFSFLIISIDWKEYDHFENNEILLLVPPRVIYDRVRNKKNNFEITAFLNYEWGTSRAVNSKSNENKNVFVFIWCFEFSRSWFSSFNLQKGGNFKIIFPLPYPIIYNPDWKHYKFVQNLKWHLFIAGDAWLAIYVYFKFLSGRRY